MKIRTNPNPKYHYLVEGKDIEINLYDYQLRDLYKGLIYFYEGVKKRTIKGERK